MLIISKKFVLSFVASLFFINIYCDKKQFVVIIPSYNNAEYCIKNLNSVFCQDYSNFRIIYIDDCSTDFTVSIVKNYIKNMKLDNKFLLIENKIKLGAMANHYRATHLCNPEEIIVHLDGDDWFADNTVLSYLNQIYQDPNIWVTYGQYKVYSKKNILACCKELPEWVINNNAYRDYPFVTSHLRTFYAGLFHKIKLEDFMFKGKFLQASCDIGFMMPILEMAHKHIKFIDKILYIYNAYNPIMDYKINKPILDLISYYIRDKKRYQPLESLPNFDNNNNIEIIILNLGTKDTIQKFLQQIKLLVSGYQKITVINFEQLNTVLFNAKSEYILFCSDLCQITEKIDLIECTKKLEQTDALGFFLSHEAHESINDLGQNIMAWQFGYAPKSHKITNLWDIVIIKKKNFNNFFYRLKDKHKIGLCYKKPKAKLNLDYIFANLV